jgi:hypothetical protein
MANCTYNRTRCHVILKDGSRCPKTISNAGFALAAHNAAHLRRGELIKVSKWSWKGVAIESQVIQLRDRKVYERANWFETFERCKVAYVERVGTRTAYQEERSAR